MPEPTPDAAIAAADTSPDAQLLARFVAAFQRGIERELEAVRQSADAFEIALGAGEDLGDQRYSFELADAAEATTRLVPGTECTLRTSRGDARATIDRCDDQRVALSTDLAIDLDARPIRLAIAPWFLYERMINALAEISVDRHAVGLALTLFGKRPHRRVAGDLRCDHTALNPSQRAAVQLCRDSDLAFLWGPPGTGKTATLTHVIEELLAHTQRILLTSTTNAAIDQVLAKLAEQPWFAAAVAAGTIVRLGRSDDDTFGTELAEAVARRQGAHAGAIDHLRARITAAELALRNAERLRAELATAAAPQQSLFAAPPTGLRAAALAAIFAPGLADVIARRPAPAQLAAIDLRAARLARVRTLARARVAHHTAQIRDLEAQVVGDARVVMCTLTQAYLSPLLKPQRFDTLIAEEAGMATLPALFLAASLCRDKAIMVGDPRQLPPIAQSRDPVVQRAIARSVFDVTIPDPSRSDAVAMLDVQYRMHPAIGDLVGRLFYAGRLIHAADPTRTAAIAARAPYPGRAVAILDTAGRTTCQRAARGGSRLNPASAELTADLARDAVDAGAPAVAIITPYAAQARDLRRLLAARRISGAVECSTIHRFQGRECDVVILDLVDAPPLRPGILLAGDSRSDAAHLLNVSLSRARGKLIIVADVAHFEAHAPGGIVAAILREARRIPIPLAPA